MTDASRNSRSVRFATTRWTDVLNARSNGPLARQSLRELCDRYYTPVLLFIRTYLNDAQNAEDLTHSFFVKILEGESLRHLDSAKGRFRSYLLGAVKHFLAGEKDKERSIKRGGTSTISPLEVVEVEFLRNNDADLTSDSFFDRHWALNILQHSLSQLQLEVRTTQAGKYYPLLQHNLIGEGTSLSYESISRETGLTPDAVKGILYRWRKRFREIVQSEIQATLTSDDELDLEMNYLVNCLRQAYRTK